MMNLTKVVEEQRRLAILRTLSELDFNLNEDVLLQALGEMSLAGVSHDLLRADLTFLSAHNLIRIETLAKKTGGELWIAHLLIAGQEVAAGRVHPGVARRQPDA